MLYAHWPIVELVSSIIIPQWRLTKVHSRRIGNKTETIKLTKARENYVFLISNLITTPLNECQLMPKLVSIDDQNHAGLTSQSLRTTIGLLQDNRPLFTTSLKSQESYLTNESVPFKHVSIPRDSFPMPSQYFRTAL